LGFFLLLSVATAVLAVATPVLAGRVVNAIVQRTAPDVVVGIASLIAVIAIAEAGLGLATATARTEDLAMRAQRQTVSISRSPPVTPRPVGCHPN
jgi:ABC-type bacteriocin/lantibiotic exporter with double-glycine peptidase domain